MKNKKMGLREFNISKYGGTTELKGSKFNQRKAYKLIDKYISNKKGKKFLDIGCLDGSFASLLQDDFGFESFAIDIIPSAVEETKKKGINAQVCDVANGLPFEDSSFDMVVMCEVLEHVLDTDFLLEEIKRVLKQDGHLFLTVPNCASIHARFRLMFAGRTSAIDHRIGKDTAGHIRAYTPIVLNAQLKNNGFKVVKMTSSSFLFPTTLFKLSKSLEDFFIDASDFSFNLGTRIVTVSKKS